MSAEVVITEVCIVRTIDGFRVKEINAGKQLDYDDEYLGKSPIDYPYLFKFFKNAEYFKEENDATAEAIQLFGNLCVCRYGITRRNYEVKFPDYSEDELKLFHEWEVEYWKNNN